MTHYLIVYFGGNPPESPEQAKAHFARYSQWLNALGEAIISPANPLKHTHTLTSTGAILPEGRSTMSGYTIVQAPSLDTALTMAKGCPFLELGGTLEVSELVTIKF